ncbi:winged helix-turn-helix domain-containing protein [Caballeronia sp. SEWSISQ10-4 2]|uniref:response regulator transcription factor n=1 Tax=Caballeronia sp. SEWSISQ10-4 2 TaxID=2937438 RepID=UPI00264FADA8|nr:winged helix-turn-helix domain-containing protein [Caballeronia sp. SEWSISQ10-4 2]MDN7177441.1 winged helix-turn-helix domain-containing protein [Caballeronia sp. SEWSISQ10-4 2]
MKIVTLEHDPDVSSSLNRTLRLAGYHSKGHSAGDALRRTLRAGTFDLAILDWDMADTRDNAMLDLIHQSFPFEWQVIFVIGNSEDKKALESLHRPCHYLVKPIPISNLLTRVKLFLQHVWRKEPVNNEMQFGPYSFEPANNVVRIGDTEIPLTPKEYALALLLLRSLSNPLSRVYISEKIWSRGERINARTITTHLSMIKSKLKFSQYGYRLMPIYNYGYRLDSVASDSE